MSALDESNLVSVYEAWPRGEWDFTPWLSENMDLLSKAVGFELELIQAEATLPGAMRVDVLAKIAGTEDYVVVENQMGLSDNDHLAGLLNYASHSDSKVLIWVAESFGKWACRILDWLNDADGIQIYAVKMSARYNGDMVEGQLELVAGPNRRSAEWPGYEYPPEKQKYLNFFRPVMAWLKDAGIAERSVAKPVNDQSFPSGFAGVTYHVGFWAGPSASAYLYIATDDRAFNKQIFDALHKHRPEIENKLSLEVTWHRNDNLLNSQVAAARSGSIDDSSETLAEIREWMYEAIVSLKSSIQPRLEKVMAEVASDHLGKGE